MKRESSPIQQGALLAIGACLALGGCSSELTLPPTAEAEPVHRHDNGDGTWSHRLAGSFDPTATLVTGAIEWGYIGQAKYSLNPPPRASSLSYVYRSDDNLTTTQQLRRTQMEDAQGRLWQPIRLDESRLGAPTLEAIVDDAVPRIKRSGERPEPNDGDILTWRPASWDKQDCDGDGDKDWYIWDTDNRSSIASPSAPRQRTVLQMASSAGKCSATLLGERWVLTAAHCTYESDGSSAGNYSFTNWNGESVNAIDFLFRGPGYNYGLDPEDDYALIKLDSAFPSDGGEMNLSVIGDLNIETVNPIFHNLGFPGRLNDCATETGSSTLVHTANNEITGKSSRTIRWQGDNSTGHSGGPIYYCPWSPELDRCDGDDAGYIVSVVAGFSGYYNRNIGPRASYFKDWAEYYMSIL